MQGKALVDAFHPWTLSIIIVFGRGAKGIDSSAFP